MIVLPYDALTEVQAAALFAVRHAVFVDEQQIHCEPDRDGLDPRCLHVLASCDGVVAGTCRLLPIQREGARWIKVGRLAVLASARGRGLGQALIRRCNRYLDEHDVPGVMHAQAYLEGWYASLGWQRVGEGFVEAGIDHVEMRYPRVDARG